MSDSVARPPRPPGDSPNARSRRRRGGRQPVSGGNQPAQTSDTPTSDAATKPAAKAPRRKSRGRRGPRPERATPEQPYRPQALPELTYPAELPVSGVRDEIAAAIDAHPVVVICGETGSGKTTQIPKICASVGRGRAGRIGHTQPRRIAASAVARRLAEEIGSPLGEHVGFKVRFTEQLNPGATFKIMTDGILLAEIQSDPDLRQYDTLIIDEAHERSLNIDFLLGYLKRLLDGPRRHDLKVVITSATIDADRFAAHFGQATQPAPVIQVSGRLYPVEVLYQDQLPGAPDNDEDDETDLPGQIESAIEHLWRQGTGDVLVFLPGEREIREAADHLNRAHARALSAKRGVLGKGAMEVVPLFARLSVADQQRVFSPSNGRRVVLATNVAETSLTVPGIRFVVDSGLARVKRYRLRGKVEQLQIEPISQAAASQRAGRCGRVANGVCVRLYSEQEHEQRSAFTDPEVLRSSLAAVILRMKSLRLGAVEDFPFIDQPNRRAINDGYALLTELGAVDEDRRITQIGRQLARLPLDPRIARMLLAARDESCLDELLTIASFLAVQDPRDRPLDAQQAADQAHREFADPSSDVLGILRLWRFVGDADSARRAAGESRRSLTRTLERHFVSARRMREWADVRSQLTQAVSELGWQTNRDAAKPERVHRTLLTGLLGNLGYLAPDQKLYQGTHQTRFAIHPSSALTRRSPRWIMCAEMVDTARLYGRTIAPVQPEWIEKSAGHLLARTWSEPLWSRKSGQAISYERATLYGLQIYAQRRSALSRRDAALARNMFIRHALVEDDWLEPSRSGHLPFLTRNRKLIASIRRLEDQIRRPDLLVDQDFLQQWFEARLPENVVDGRSLEQWHRQGGKTANDSLCLTREELLRKDAQGVDSSEFPLTMTMRGAQFDLSYKFDPGADDDGVTLVIPLALLNQVDVERCEWLVPGLLRTKVAALAKSLPQRIRRHLVPLPAYADAFVERHGRADPSGSLVQALLEDVREQFRVPVTLADFRPDTLSAHLFMRYRLLDANGRQLGTSRQLTALQAAHGQQARGAFREAFAAAAVNIRATHAAPDANDEVMGDVEPASPRAAVEPASDPSADSVQALIGERFSRWPLNEMPGIVEVRQPGTKASIVGFPALVDHGESIAFEVLDDERTAQQRHRLGVRRLLMIACRQPLKALHRGDADNHKRVIAYARIGTDDSLKRSIDAAVIDRASAGQSVPLNRAAYDELVVQVRGRIGLIGVEVQRRLDDIMAEHVLVMRKRQASRAGHDEDYVRATLADVDTQLQHLIYDGFIADTPAEQFAHLPRYLKAIVMRLTHMRADPQREVKHTQALQQLAQRFERLRQTRRDLADPELDQFRWLLEELRVSLFAQKLRTPMPVSIKRLNKILESAGA
ncbi:MAG: ATP-dependent RNA helicase HrpA [Burkholderiaceae bacterium]